MKEEKAKQLFTISSLIVGHFNGTLTAEQQQQLKDWIDANETNKTFLEEVIVKHNFANYRKEFKAIDSDSALTQVKNKIQGTNRVRKGVGIFIWKKLFLRAAVILIILSAGIGTYLMRNNTNTIGIQKYKSDIGPGGNRATLTLANGSSINLSDNQDGIIIDDSTIKYVGGGVVVESDSLKEKQFVLRTPKGGQYQLTLADGTKVWLNAESTLKYPSRFSGKERRLELEGEAYFEVAHNSKQPFIVTSTNQEVTVLGTHFNISAYKDEKDSKTTLIEGSVSVSHTLPYRNAKGQYSPGNPTLLRPGQQAVLNKDNHTLRVKSVNNDMALAWTKGNFQFESESIEEVMAKIARWYDVTIEYKGPKPTNQFNGFTSRGENVSEILFILEKTGSVRFEIEGRKIIVKK